MPGDLNLFKNLEELARSNRWLEIENSISNLKRSTLKPNDALKLANMARRAYQLDLSLRILKPFVFKTGGEINIKASPAMLSEYATVLLMLGATRSAEKILNAMPAEQEESLFVWITYYFAISDYESALHYSQLYTKTIDDPYFKKVGELNQCACLVAVGRAEEALVLLKSLEEYFLKHDHKLLYANSQELKGQILIQSEKWIEAKNQLHEAKKLHEGDNQLYKLFVDKWLLISKMFTDSFDKSKVTDFIQKASELNNPQSIRDILFFSAKRTTDEGLYRLLYFGTPFKSYRKTIQGEAGFRVDDSTYNWNGNYFDTRWEKMFDPYDQRFHLSELERKALLFFTEDFFASASIGMVFDGIFSDEYFDPEFSKAKTYKLIQRLNKRLNDLNVGLTILNKGGRYALAFSDSWMVRKLNPDLSSLGLEFPEIQFAQGLSDQSFSRLEFETALQLSKSKANRKLKSLAERGLIERIGQGPGSFYRFLNLK